MYVYIVLFNDYRTFFSNKKKPKVITKTKCIDATLTNNLLDCIYLNTNTHNF